MTYKGVVPAQTDTLPKENCMNKKFIAFALVLLIVVGGLFAAEVSLPDAKYAYLVGNIGKYLEHGFDDVQDDSVQYQSSINVPNALNAAGVSFTYRYRTNYTEALSILMDITDFIHDNETDSIAIGSVTRGTGATPFEKVGDKYKITQTSGDGVISESIKINVKPEAFDEEDEVPGKYTSTVTVTVDTV